MMSKSAVSHDGVCNMAAFLHGYAEIISDDESRSEYTQKTVLDS